jgi:serine/threonine-protein kinase RsbW
VFAIPLPVRFVKQDWRTLSFSSTLYLCPILDLLLAGVPRRWQPELRLGLQEALVNAAKHGNNLDPSKTVSVRYLIQGSDCCWVISDEGSGIANPKCWELPLVCSTPQVEQECGRGFFILHQIFDQVQWNQECGELRLSKQFKAAKKQPILC